jgi:hypothetical protein
VAWFSGTEAAPGPRPRALVFLTLQLRHLPLRLNLAITIRHRDKAGPNPILYIRSSMHSLAGLPPADNNGPSSAMVLTLSPVRLSRQLCAVQVLESFDGERGARYGLIPTHSVFGRQQPSESFEGALAVSESVWV